MADRSCRRTQWRWRWMLSSTTACRMPRYRWWTWKTQPGRRGCSLRRRYALFSEPRTSRRSSQTARTSATLCRCPTCVYLWRIWMRERSTAQNLSPKVTPCWVPATTASANRITSAKKVVLSSVLVYLFVSRIT